jgi:glucokinase
MMEDELLFKRSSFLLGMILFFIEKNVFKLAKRVIHQVAHHLGLALANLANGLNPEKIVIGGGVSKAGDTLLGPLKEEFVLFAFPRVAQGVEIVIATLGNNAGVIGGAWLAKEKLINKSKLQ